MTPEPLVSIVMPVLNAERNLARALPTLASQTLGADRFEIIVADAGSSDRTIQVLQSYRSILNIRVIDNSVRREPNWGKAVGIEAARGSLIQCMDSDMWMPSSRLLEALVAPLVEDPSLAGTIASYVYDPSLSLWSRYLSCDEFQRDPLYQALTPGIDEFEVEQRANYRVYHFPTARVPPFGGTTMYRHGDIDLSRWGGPFNELDQAASLVKAGRDRFAHISASYGWAHDHCSSLTDLIRKRRRNLLQMSNGYLQDSGRKDFIWVDTTNRHEVLRLLSFLISAHLVAPEIVRGVLHAFRSRHWEATLRPIASLALTDAVLLSLLSIPEGRSLLRAALLGRPARKE